MQAEEVHNCIVFTRAKRHLDVEIKIFIKQMEVRLQMLTTASIPRNMA